VNRATILKSDTPVHWLARGAVLAVVAPPLILFLFEAAAGFRAAAQAESQVVFSWAILWRSVFIAGCTAAASAAIGVFAGTVAGRLGKVGAAIALFSFVMPLAAPPAVHAYIWRNAALSAGLLGDLFVEGGSRAINFTGAVASMVSAFWTIPALAAFAACAGPGRRYELEARPFAAPGVAARKVLLPTIVPAAAASAGLVFILAFGDYSVPALWQINTYPVHILSLYSSFFEPRLAAAAALVPAAVTGAAAAVVFAIAGRALSRADVEKANVERNILWAPGTGAKAGLAAVVGILCWLPVGVSAYWAWRSWPGAAGLGVVGKDFAFTLSVACAAAALASALAVLAAAGHWTKGRGWRNALLAAALAAFLLPAVGIGLAVKGISQWRFVPPAFGDSAAAYVYALAARFIAVPLVLSAMAMSRIDRAYAHLVEVSGARGSRALFTVGVPLALPAAIAGGVMAIVLGVAELPIAMLVAPPGRPPISVDLFNLMHYARQGEAFAAALAMMLGASAVVVAALATAGKLWKRYLSAQ